MDNKFALIKFAKSMKEIPIKHEIFRKFPERVLKFYVNKSLYYAVDIVEICGISGYEITLPMLNEDNAALLGKIMEKVEGNCRDLGVRAIIAERGIPVAAGFFAPDGYLVKPFFLGAVIDKYLKFAGINPAQAQIIIIEGEEDFTKSIGKLIYNKFNYLGIILEANEQADYETFAAEIFDDCGLALNFGRRGSYLLKEADIIINLSDNSKGYESFYKKGVCYIELSTGNEKLKSLLANREGIAAVDKFNIEYMGERLNLAQYEMIAYLDLPDFARYAGNSNKEKHFSNAAKSIEGHNAKLRNLNM